MAGGGGLAGLDYCNSVRLIINKRRVLLQFNRNVLGVVFYVYLGVMLPHVLSSSSLSLFFSLFVYFSSDRSARTFSSTG